MFEASIAPIGGNLTVSALVACLPLLVFFIMLLGVKAKAHTSGMVALATAIIVAIIGWNMPTEYALMSALQGACYGAFPIAWIVIMAVWFYRMSVLSGRFEDLRRFFDQIGGGDIRIQAVLIAFCFGGLLEALAGFGAPIAITATMLLTLGVKPKRAAMVCLIVNTAPVAFGAIGTPILTAGSVVAGGDAVLSAQYASHIAAIAGHQAPLFAAVVPLLAMIILDGKQGVRDCWLPCLVIGLSFAVVQWWCSNFFAFELTDVMASLVSLFVAVLFMHFWRPRNVDEARARFELPPVEGEAVKLPAVRTWMCLMPYAIVVAVFAICKLGINDWLATFNTKFAWPIIGG
jgi:lactate permease